MPTLKNSAPLLCPNCGNPLVITKTAVEEADLKKHTRRSTVQCPHCKLSIKEAIAKKLNKHDSKL